MAYSYEGLSTVPVFKKGDRAEASNYVGPWCNVIDIITDVCGQ